ncbi:hypothetical protein BROUX41_003816 [Berkeleyomyces rouxiae]|uniref:uncharacterized protein n=1 Tax=Berkeleyomyces rouxiae TaxID=2035830 RepID=UPI003B7C12B7
MLSGWISYWTLPVISGVTWLAMLLAMLIYWAGHQDAAHLISMEDDQTIAYISDIGALTLKPLFIAGSSVTAVFFAVSFIATRWLRHRGRLLPNVTMFQRVLISLNILSALVGMAGLIFLTIFDAHRHSNVHTICLVLFLLGFIFSAVFACWEFHSLRRYYTEEPLLRVSFWVKFVFIIVEGSLAITFGVLARQDEYDAAAVLEWIIAIIFTFYVFSYVMDLWPAVHTKKPEMRYKRSAQGQSESPDSTSISPQAMEEGSVQQPPRALLGNF